MKSGAAPVGAPDLESGADRPLVFVVVDSPVLAVALRNRPTLWELRVIESFGPSPIQPVVARPALDAGLRSQLREAPVSLSGDTLDQGRVERRVAVRNQQCHPIRSMLVRVNRNLLVVSATDRAESRMSFR